MKDVFLSIIVPAFNEEHRIVKSLKEDFNYFGSKDFTYEIIVVDDGSRDNTVKTIEDNFNNNEYLRVLKNGRNRGKGYSVRRGMLEAKGEYILYCDADNATPIEELDKLIAALQKDNADFAYGSRNIREEAGFLKTVFRAALGSGFLFLAHFIVLKKPICDTQCGFKCFKRKVAQEIFKRVLIENGVFDVEVFFIAQKLGYTRIAVPVQWRYIPGSTINVCKCVLGDPFSMFKIRFNDLLKRYE